MTANLRPSTSHCVCLQTQMYPLINKDLLGLFYIHGYYATPRLLFFKSLTSCVWTLCHLEHVNLFNCYKEVIYYYIYTCVCMCIIYYHSILWFRISPSMMDIKVVSSSSNYKQFCNAPLSIWNYLNYFI